jgi:hypothetical protein
MKAAKNLVTEIAEFPINAAIMTFFDALADINYPERYFYKTGIAFNSM